MKKILFTFGTLFLIGATVSAQSTVDSIAAKYKLQPMPEALTVEKTFPVIGTYQLESGADATTGTNTTTGTTGMTGTDASTTGTLMISLDPTNKGMIWIEGLPQGRIKAYLRKSPGTYRILAQTTETGKKVKEGVLHLDPTTNTLHIALGKTYDDADPIGVFGLTTSMDASTGINTSMGTTNTTTGTTGNTTTGMNTSTDANASANASTGTTGQSETKVKSPNGTKVKTEYENDGTVKVKTKTPTSKTKEKITFYTATKVGMSNTTTNTMQQQQQQQQQPQQPQQQQQQQ